MIIPNKAEFFRLWEAGVLGNRTNIWRHPEEAYLSGAPEIGFREVGRAGGGAWTRCPREQVFDVARQWSSLGRKFIMDDGCPDEKRLIQGEICRTYRGLEGYIDVGAKLPMRGAAAAGHMKNYSGSMVAWLTQKYMDPSSLDDLYMLLDLYPDATIEFTTFSVDVGVFPNRNTLFWETRNY